MTMAKFARPRWRSVPVVVLALVVSSACSAAAQQPGQGQAPDAVASLPQGKLKEEATLLFQPEGDDVNDDTAPVGTPVSVMGRNESDEWLRVMRSDAVSGLSNEWTADKGGQYVAVVDLFRDGAGTVVEGTFQLRVNGAPLKERSRPLSSSGQFLMRGAALSTPDRLKPGDRLGFAIAASNVDNIKLFAAVFQVPNGCQFLDAVA
jgi:hypothetical protein